MTTLLCSEAVSAREDPQPCREQDLGKFEVVARDGAARLGRLHTRHGVLDTPMLLPVVNPNIRTIEPREMWERYHVDALITNSYVAWKHKKLREPALADGIHALLDFPSVIVTDSGTFQSYVYGDVEVGVEEIVEFQRDIGVDIGTMLDVFGRPDMSREELENAVAETAARAEDSLAAAGENLLLNGPVQGGLHDDLRAQAGELMGAARGEFRGFAVHPIGGIVPLMEKQRYRELFEILLAARSTIPPHRPIHLFGCGHPLLFPMAIALGADLFDSAAYALFARDDRLLSPHGTVKLAEITEWPVHSIALFPHTPAQVRAMDKGERSVLLAHHNLEITQAELARCREAVRNGTIWRLAEQRSHCSAQLRDAFLWLLGQMVDPDEGPVGQTVLRHIASTNPIRGNSEVFGEEIDSRPHILHLNALLAMRWRRPGSWWNGEDSSAKRVVLLVGAAPPWRDSALGDAISALAEEAASIILISTPLGPVPFTLEDVSPWCHIDGPDDLWELVLTEVEMDAWIEDLGLAGIPMEVHVCESSSDETEGGAERDVIRAWIDRCAVVDKLSLLCGIEPAAACRLTEGMSSRRSRTDRMINVFVDDEHLFSPRLTDGALSLTLAGARRLHALNPGTPTCFTDEIPVEDRDHPGIPRIQLLEDAIPFVGQGRNVMHGYILGADSHVIIGQPCLIVDESGELVAHGIANASADDMAFFNKGIAVKVRDGARRD